MIELFDDYVIVVDELNYRLCKRMGKRKDKNGNETDEWNYKGYGYFGSVEAALKALSGILSNERLRGRESTLSEAVQAIRESNEAVKKVIERVT